MIIKEFEKSNSFVYQRLFGELHMDDWPVTQTKDSFDWYSGLEDLLIEKLLVECDEYRKKAKEYRKGKKVDVKTGISTLVQKLTTAGIINDVSISDVPQEIIEESENRPNESESGAQQIDTTEQVPPAKTGTAANGDLQIVGTNGQKLSFVCGGESYTFHFILKSNDPDARWLNILTKGDEYIIEWNIRHPFFKPYIDDPKFLELMQQFTFALALAEIESRRTSVDGKVSPAAIRNKMNEALKAVIKE